MSLGFSNPLWFLGMHFRFAASISTISQDERGIFSHIPNSELFFGLLKQNAWRHNLASYLGINEYNNKGFELPDYHGTYLPSSKIENRMQRLLPPEVVYPCLGVGKFGVAFLVKSYLGDIFPLGFPMESQRAHGTKLSTYGFGVHDYLHKKVDRRRYELIAHVLEEAEKYYLKGGNVHTFAKLYPQVAVAKYMKLMGSLGEIYGFMVAKLLPYRGKGEFRKALVGSFWIMHENPNFPRNIYRKNDFDGILRTITEDGQLSGVNAAVNETDSWESSIDPLETSPLDGSSALKDEEIFQFVLKTMTMDDAQSRKYQLYKSELPIDEKEIKKKETKSTPHFIDVIFKMRNGEKLKYSFPTLYHKWLNMDDNIGLLRYGGTRIQKPDLLGLENPRDIAQKTLDLVEKSIGDHVEFFLTVASFFANYDPQGDENTLSQRYFRWHFNLENKVKAQLEKSQ